MKITEEQVRYVAELANLRLTEEEVHRMAREMDEILTHIEKLNELDTSSVEPMAQVLFDSEDGFALRVDEPRPGIGSETATTNAPQSGQGYFKIPKVIER